MRSLLLPIVLLWPLASPSLAQPPGLTIEGETYTVVSKVPFKVNAPAGGKLYFWRMPAGWKADSTIGSASATVTEAPDGTAVVAVDAVASDFTVKTYTLKVNVGTGAGPLPPIPPTDPLVKAIQAAYDSVAVGEAATRAADLVQLTALHRQAATICTDPAITTYGDLTGRIHAAGQALLADRLKPLRQVLAAEKAKVLPTTPSTLLDAPGRSTAARLHTRFATSLQGVRP